MSDNLMDTEKGGEQTQYEGAATFVKPHAKEAGQLGDSTEQTQSPTTSTPKTATNAPNTQGITPADKIRYGQAIQEGGMGGKTEGMTGEADAEGKDEGGDGARKAMGYGEGSGVGG